MLTLEERRKKIPEVLWIKNTKKADLLLMRLPEQFFYAISAINYHPPDERLEGGLVLHTRRVLTMIKSLCRVFDATEASEQRLLIAGLVHDHNKSGWILNKKLLLQVQLSDLLDKETLKLIEHHGGRWSRGGLLRTDEGLIMHIADFVASRFYVKVEPGRVDS